MKAENAYRTIAEVSELLGVPASVLRFWETQFHQIKPLKRMGRRHYGAQDVVLLARIRDYLYKEGFTIKGVQKRLKTGDPSEEKENVSQELKSLDAFVAEMSEVKAYLSEHL